jgi:hypothetical protein
LHQRQHSAFALALRILQRCFSLGWQFAALAGWKGTAGKFVVVHGSGFGNAPVTYTFVFLLIMRLLALWGSIRVMIIA